MLLAIDPGKHALGYALFLEGNLVHSGSESFSDCPDLKALVRAYDRWILDALKRHGVTWIAYERSHPRNMVHADQFYGLVALLHLRSENRPVTAITWSAAKKALCGNGLASKGDMLMTASNLYPTIDIDSYDAADAVGVGLAAYQEREQE